MLTYLSTRFSPACTSPLVRYRIKLVGEILPLLATSESQQLSRVHWHEMQSIPAPWWRYAAVPCSNPKQTNPPNCFLRAAEVVGTAFRLGAIEKW